MVAYRHCTCNLEEVAVVEYRHCTCKLERLRDVGEVGEVAEVADSLGQGCSRSA